MYHKITTKVVYIEWPHLYYPTIKENIRKNVASFISDIMHH